MRRRTLGALILALLLPFTGARAFSPAGYRELTSAYEKGQALRLDLTGELRQWNALSGGSLSALSGWLRDTRLRLLFSKSADWVELIRGSETLLSLSAGERNGKKLLAVDQGGPVFETAGAADPLSVLAQGEAPDFSWLLKLPDPALLRDLPPDAAALLVPFEKEVKRNASVRNVGASPRRLEYTLDAESWQAVWPKLRQSLTESLIGLPLDVEGILPGLRFEKPVTIKRLLDRQGGPLGWQMGTTVLLPSGVSRKVSLSCGYGEGKGLHLSLKAPARRGSDELTLALSMAFDSASLNLDLALTSRLDGARRRVKGSAALSLAQGEDAERLSGKAWLEVKEGKEPARRLSLAPDLVYRQGRLEGSVSLLSEKGGKPGLDLTLRGGLEKAEAPNLPETTGAYDPDADPEAARAVLAAALLPKVQGVLMSFPKDVRLLLLHDMGRTARTEGDAVPAGERAPEYVVAEDADRGGTP